MFLDEINDLVQKKKKRVIISETSLNDFVPLLFNVCLSCIQDV